MYSGDPLTGGQHLPQCENSGGQVFMFHVLQYSAAFNFHYLILKELFAGFEFKKTLIYDLIYLLL